MHVIGFDSLLEIALNSYDVLVDDSIDVTTSIQIDYT